MGNLSSCPTSPSKPKTKNHPNRNQDWLGPTPIEIFEVRDILMKCGKLPIELSCEILDLAEYWTKDVIRSDHQVIVERGQETIFDIDLLYDSTYMSNVLAWHRNYLKSQTTESPSEGAVINDRLPNSSNAQIYTAKVMKIEWTVVSHDQGWSSYPDDHGTDRNSWTWTEASLYTRNRFNQSFESQLSSNSIPHRICTNIHAKRKSSLHKHIWNPNHPLLIELNLRLRSLSNSFDFKEEQDSIGFCVNAVAQYNGWVNTVELVECKFFYSFT
ncbi:hypothetical protein CROQUDRAFT_665060 [Cronartium quercuum f. sp. fusiforme G11]|uniref:Uncharacterized protein n=1 Tax=Cronartium quercuum f. sp. fusiforme G11 TaxID=708437 RepID=A0A9P6T6G5_9BASI|nr:hypothetical protein CROQUDRAFT_665060 [Cronartium quercuum f. sp. fusiforme G11]